MILRISAIFSTPGEDTGADAELPVSVKVEERCVLPAVTGIGQLVEEEVIHKAQHIELRLVSIETGVIVIGIKAFFKAADLLTNLFVRSPPVDHDPAAAPDGVRISVVHKGDDLFRRRL